MQKILIIDDEEGIRFGFKTHLSKAGYNASVVEDYNSAIQAIDNSNFDLIISDIILDSHTGIDILREIKRRGMVCPVIMVTGRPGVGTASEAVRLGAFDYLPKPVRKETLLNTAAVALKHKAALDDKKRIEIKKTKHSNNLHAIFKSLKEAIITVDENMRIMEANKEVFKICGMTPEDIRGKRFKSSFDECSRECYCTIRETLQKKTTNELSIRCSRADVQNQQVLLSCTPLEGKKDEFNGAVLVVRDITESTETEKKLNPDKESGEFIGKSESMRKIFSLIKNLAGVETTVIITGESGTGKEMAARAIHNRSKRAGMPFVEVNCNALSENLLESELFGHVKGAFTGAIRDKTGRFQMAAGGTVFLDEIGDISQSVQLKLLRVLQEQKFERVGESVTKKVDVRIIAATNRNLKEKIKKGEFREDLYYRLNVIEVVMPPLRNRVEDIPLLVNHFLNIFKRKIDRTAECVSDDVMALFLRHHWPGNVRELEHAIEHAFVLCHENIIRVEHLPQEVQKSVKIEFDEADTGFTDEYHRIVHVLKLSGWNKSKAARILGMSRQNIYRKIKKYRIDSPF